MAGGPVLPTRGRIGSPADAPIVDRSYAGAKVALLRKLYPDVVYGAIASSAVTTAITDYWKYFEAIRLHAPQECVNAIVDSVS